MSDVPVKDKSGLSDRAYTQLRAGLVSCALPPGSRLNISRLRKELEVSQAAVREALSRLCAEGLVIAEHNAGFRATPVLAGGYRGLAMACNLIEGPCLVSSMDHGDALWERNLLASYEESRDALQHVVEGSEEIDSYATHRKAFHDALFAACDNKWLLSAWSVLYLQHMRYRQTFAALARFESQLYGDYTHFLEVVRARRADEAVRLWTENHLKVVQFFEDNLETAAPGPARGSRRSTAVASRAPLLAPVAD